MNKKKILTSLALAGVLTAGVIGANVKASTNDNGIFNSLVNNHKNVVPYVVAEGNSNVTIADIVKDFGGSVSITSVKRGNDYLTGLSSETVISTGDEFKIAGTTYTALVYGDVNKDGEIDAFDAKDVLQYAVGNKTLDALAIEAADVDDPTANEVDSFDAKEILKFGVGTKTKIGTLPSKEEDKDEVVSDNYTLTIADDNIISNVELGDDKTFATDNNADDATTFGTASFKIKLNKALTKAQYDDIANHKVYVDIYGKTNTGVEVKTLGTNVIGVATLAYTNGETEFTGKIAVDDMEANKLDASNTPVVKEYTAKLRANVGGKDVILGTTTIKYDNNITTPAITDPTINRNNSDEATVTVETISGHEATQIYYAAKNAEVTAANFKTYIDNDTLEANDVEVADLSSGKATLKLTGVSNNDVFSYYLVNENGNVKQGTKVIPNTGILAPVAPQLTVDLTDDGEIVYTAQFDSTDESNINGAGTAVKYKLQLFNATGALMGEDKEYSVTPSATSSKVEFTPFTTTGGNGKKATDDSTGKDFVELIKETGKYKLVLYVTKGTGATYVESIKADAPQVSINKLATSKVSYTKIVNPDDETKLLDQFSFNYDKNMILNTKQMTIDLKKYAKATKTYNHATTITLTINDANDNKMIDVDEIASDIATDSVKYENGVVTITALTGNELIDNDVAYQATFKALPKTQEYVASEETNSDIFADLTVGTIAAASDVVLSDTTGTIALTLPAGDLTEIEGLGDIDYSVEAYKYTTAADLSTTKELVSVDSEVVRDKTTNEITITSNKITFKLSNLEADKAYQFRVKGYISETVQGKTELAPATAKSTLLSLPSYNGLVYAGNSATDAVKKGYFGTGADGKYINGTKLLADAKYSTEDITLFNSILAALGTKAGATVNVQKVTDVNDEDGHKFNITFDFTGEKVLVAPTLTLSNGFATADVTVNPNGDKGTEIIGDGADVRNLYINAGDTITVTGLAVVAGDINDNEEGVQKAAIILNNGVKVSGNNTYRIAKNATVTINGVSITTANEIDVDADAQAFTFTNTSDSKTLTFANETGKAITVAFTGNAGLTQGQVANPGSITINSNGAVTINTATENVDADITMRLTDSKADLSNASLKGAKSVTLVNSQKINGKNYTGKSAGVTANIANLTKAQYDILNKTGLLTNVTGTDATPVVTIKAYEYDTTYTDVNGKPTTIKNLTQDEIATFNSILASFGSGLVNNATIQFVGVDATGATNPNDKCSGKVVIELTTRTSEAPTVANVTNIK